MGATLDQKVALVTVIATLAVTSVGLFIWMAIDGWTDRAGVGVAILFIVVSAIQMVFSIWWYREVKTVTFDVQHSNRELANLAETKA